MNMSEVAKVFVTDGRSLAALAIARSLGSKGIEVHCGDDFATNVTSFSRYVKHNYVYPQPEAEPERFVDFLLKLVERENYDLILPVRDKTTEIISQYKDRFLDRTNLLIADYNIIQKFMDKGETIKLARDAKVSIPNTYFPEEESIEQISHKVTYPALVRPRRSSGSRGIEYVNSQNDLLKAYHYVRSQYGEPIIQEYISHEGGHYSVATLFDSNSNPVSTHVYVETKQYPISGGPAVNAVSVEKPAWVDEYLRFLKDNNWVGPAHMDVLYDINTNRPRLLEVNPRFWMSLNLSIQSGVDFPYLLYQLSTGEKVRPTQEYQTGVKYRWMLPNEILWLFQAKNKTQGLLDLLRFREKGTCHATYNKEDLKPLFGVFAQGLYFLAHSEKRKFMFKRGW
jgi:predicted ATP-grasp superfamily ATP-dependent carboligase